MNKVYIVFASLLIFVIIVLIYSKNEMQEKVDGLSESIEQLSGEIESLKSENAHIISENNTLESKMLNQKEEVDALKSIIEEKDQMINVMELEKEARLERFSNLQSALSDFYKEVNHEIGSEILAKSLSIIDPESITKGSQVGSLKVSNVNIDRDNNGRVYLYQIDFNGDFVVSGEIMIDEVVGGYNFIVDNNQFKYIPHTIDDLPRDILSFGIRNGEKLEKILGDRLLELTPGERLPTKVLFRDYSMGYKAESDMLSDSAEFVRLAE